MECVIHSRALEMRMNNDELHSKRLLAFAHNLDVSVHKLNETRRVYTERRSTRNEATN